jgi:hypothetical protein
MTISYFNFVASSYINAMSTALDRYMERSDPESFALLQGLRGAGWTVAVHNDYQLNREFHTFYLFTHPSGVWAKGEGTSDLIALTEAKKQADARLGGLISKDRLQDIRDVLERGEATGGPNGIYPMAADVRLLLDSYLRMTQMTLELSNILTGPVMPLPTIT